MARQQRKYTDEFRADAVKLARGTDQPIAQTARDLLTCDTIPEAVEKGKQREALSSDS